MAGIKARAPHAPSALSNSGLYQLRVGRKHQCSLLVTLGKYRARIDISSRRQHQSQPFTRISASAALPRVRAHCSPGVVPNATARSNLARLLVHASRKQQLGRQQPQLVDLLFCAGLRRRCYCLSCSARCSPTGRLTIETISPFILAWYAIHSR